MSIIFASLQHGQLPINVKIGVTIWQIVYIKMTALSSNLIWKKWWLHSYTFKAEVGYTLYKEK